MGRLTTHVLDTAAGRPGAGIRLVVERLDADGERTRVAEAVTNADGRCDAPLLEGDALVAAEHEIRFAVGDYFRAREGGAAPEDGTSPDALGPRFLDTVVVRFGIAHPDEHYHVPLLVSPHAYSTYRGS